MQPFKLKLLSMSVLAALILLVACTPTAEPAPATTAPSNANEALQPAPTTAVSTPATTLEPYPAAPAAGTTVEPAYPGTQPALPSAQNPYPDDSVWVLHPVGVQCEDESERRYGDLDAAVAALNAAGVETLAAESTNLPVTAVCGGPTSAHYRVQINPANLDQALEMGWSQAQ